MRWSSVFAAVGLFVLALGAVIYVLPFVFPTCTVAQYSVCTPSYLSPAQSIEVFFVGLAFVGVALVVAVQELEASLLQESPDQGRA